MSPDPAKIQALKSLPEPKDEKLLQSFLGMVNYLSRFDPNIANMTHNLRDLLKKDSDPKWTDIHSLDFKRIIETLSKEGKVLKYYRPELELYIETDASGKGIGMALLQSEENERSSLYPIAYGSKTLTSAETRYANIERELLGVVGALEKFHYFTFGHPVVILTDHKPLIAISKKALVNAPPHLQRLLLRMNNYNVSLKWIPGKEMIFADHLSRNIGPNQSNEPTCSGLDLKIQDIYLNASEDRCISLAKETENDETLITLKNMVLKGWPDKRDECPEILKPYWTYRDELSILDGLVLKGTRIIIPNSCRDDVLDKVHEGHFGIERTKLRARDTVYWPQMNHDIETLIKSCDKCQEFSKRNNKDPDIPREIPLVPWSLLEMDLFSMDDSTFLLVVDVTSRFPVVRILSSKSANSVINALKGVYCDFGLPKRVLSDNGPCFKSRNFIEFHEKLGINVEKSSAYNHQSIGSVERMVQTIKQIMNKNAENAWLAMLIFRATAIPGINKSPSEILNGRKFRTNLPMIDFHQKTNETEIESLAKKRMSKSMKGQELSKLPVGTPILYDVNLDSSKIKCPTWLKGTVKNRLGERKYEILTDSDRVITRSRRHLKGYRTRSGRISKAPERFGNT